MLFSGKNKIITSSMYMKLKLRFITDKYIIFITVNLEKSILKTLSVHQLLNKISKDFMIPQ